MNQDQLLAINKYFNERLDSLENDFRRAYYEISVTPTIQVSPFPIVMYIMASLDLFSSLWLGWSDSRNRGSDIRSQTERMVDFLSKFTSYDPNKSKIMINMYRHKLMHTSEARRLLDEETGEVYLMNISSILPPREYLEVRAEEKYRWLQFGVKNFIDDLKNAVFGENMYYNQLTTDANLQENFIKCWNELNSYTI